MNRYRIASIPGDGIGQEVVPAAIDVLDAAAARFGFALEWTSFPWGAEHHLAHGAMMPADGLAQLRPFDAILLGAVGDPRLGSEAIATIRREHPHARILVLTTYDGIEDIHRALHAGARGYLLKDTLRRELVEAVRTVHRGGLWVSPPVAQRLAESVHHSALTPREREILGCIVRGLSNKEIAVELGVSEGTVRIHVSHVLEKLAVSDRTQAAVAAIERGIVHLDRLPEP